MERYWNQNETLHFKEVFSSSGTEIFETTNKTEGRSEVQRANPLSPVKSADERSEERATCSSGMKWSEGVWLRTGNQKVYILLVTLK